MNVKMRRKFTKKHMKGLAVASGRSQLKKKGKKYFSMLSKKRWEIYYKKHGKKTNSKKTKK